MAFALHFTLDAILAIGVEQESQILSVREKGIRPDNLRRWFLLRIVSCLRDQGFLEVESMLWTIFVILLVLWLLGIVSSYTLGGFIHLLLVLAVIVLILQLVTGRRPVV
jgi:hypothetical protein